MSWIYLPHYEGFDTVAIWPCKDTVSIQLKKNIKFELILKFFIKVISCYGLLSTSMISSPVATGMKILVPLYQGVRYGAFQARNRDEVRLILNPILLIQIYFSGWDCYFLQGEAIHALLP